ncbi:MAG: hypothetical protein ACXVLQ_10930 [Bacteriovorax sp.]
MAYQNSDRSRQSEKTRDVNEHYKRGAVKGRKKDKVKKIREGRS